MFRVKLPTHLIDFWSLKSILKSLEIIFASVGPLGKNTVLKERNSFMAHQGMPGLFLDTNQSQ